jgi:hypothetical protein
MRRQVVSPASHARHCGERRYLCSAVKHVNTLASALERENYIGDRHRMAKITGGRPLRRAHNEHFAMGVALRNLLPSAAAEFH